MQLKMILHVAHPRSTQAQIIARTPTWVNQKGYTTLHKLTYMAQNNFAGCISQEYSGTDQCHDSHLGEPEWIYNIT